VSILKTVLYTHDGRAVPQTVKRVEATDCAISLRLDEVRSGDDEATLEVRMSVNNIPVLVAMLADSFPTNTYEAMKSAVKHIESQPAYDRT
jgi:hypothetical protein